MTRTTRRIIFYCAILIFITVGYVALVYAQGYKYNFNEGKLVRSGALHINANTSASILINGREKASTGLIGNSASVGGLLPATYTVSIQKEGWSTWQKKVIIKAGFVEDFSHVMLLPQIGQDKENVKQEIYDLLYPHIASSSLSPSPSLSPTPKKSSSPSPTPSPTPIPYINDRYYLEKESLYVRSDDGPIKIASNVKIATLSNDNQKIAWLSGDQVWVYWLVDTNYQPVHYVGDVALVTHFNYPVKALAWFRDNDHLAIDVSGFKVIEIDTRPGLNTINF